MSKSVVPNTLIISTLIATLTILTGAVLSSTTVQAADSSETVVLDVLPTCTLGATGTETHNASTGGSVYIPDIGTSTISAFCNDSAGFAIYAVGFTDDEEGKNVLTDASLGATYDIVTGTATSGATSNWAMKLNLVQDSGDTAGTNAFTIDNGFNDYRSVPSTSTIVAHKTTSTDMTPVTGGVKLTSTYAIFASPTQPAGSYHGRVKYTLVHPLSEIPPQPQVTETGYICYYPSSSDIEGTMGCQTVPESATSITLLASNFSRQGYGFAGWSDKFNYAIDPDAKFYGPHEDIAFEEGQYTGTNPGLSLYAVWVKSEGSIQDSAKVASVCSNLVIAPTDGTANLTSVSALTDQRDNNTYAIAKLADGECWMIENLRLDHTATHNSDGALAQGYGTSTTYGDFAGLANPETEGFAYDYSPNSLYSKDGSNGTINIGGSMDVEYRMPRYNNSNNQSASTNRPQDPTVNYAVNSTTNAGIYSYGNYYSWAAAIADTGYYTSEDHGTTSICPAGWRIPQGNTATAGFMKLNIAIGGTGPYQSVSSHWREYPNNFTYSGSVINSSITGRGDIGVYQSSTPNDNTRTRVLIFDASTLYPGNFGAAKVNGYSIRCVAGS